MGGIVYYEVVLARFLLHCNPKYVMCAKLYEGLYELFLTDLLHIQLIFTTKLGVIYYLDAIAGNIHR